MAKLDNSERLGHAMMLAWQRLKKSQSRTWGEWMIIGDGLMEGRRWAQKKSGSPKPEGKGYTLAMGEWLSRFKVNDLHASDRAKLLQLMEERPAIEEWRAALTDGQRRNLNNPTVVWSKWREDTKIKKPKSRTAGVSATEYGRAQAMVEQMQARIDELEQERASAKDEIELLKARITELEEALERAGVAVPLWSTEGQGHEAAQVV